MDGGTAGRRFEGKVAYVTGAASGLGRVVATRLAAEGASVFAADVDAGRLDGLAAEVDEAGGTLRFRRTDITSAEECHAGVAAAVDAFGPVTTLCNIAGVLRMNHLADVTPDELDLLWKVNVSGTFFTTQAAMPSLLETHGTVVNIASTAGVIGQAYMAPYCATKGAVVQMTKALAMEFMRRKVNINAVAPGGMDTPMVQGLQFAEGIDDRLVDRYAGLRRMGTPNDVAGTVLFLCSDDARYVNGVVWSVDGGLTTG